MENILRQAQELYSLCVSKKQELEAREKKLAEAEKSVSNKDVALRAREDGLSVRETEAKKIEDIVSYQEETKRIQIENKQQWIALNKAKADFEEFSKNQRRILNEQTSKANELVTSNEKISAELQAGLKQLAIDKANMREKLIKEIHAQIK